MSFRSYVTALVVLVVGAWIVGCSVLVALGWLNGVPAADVRVACTWCVIFAVITFPVVSLPAAVLASSRNTAWSVAAGVVAGLIPAAMMAGFFGGRTLFEARVVPIVGVFVAIQILFIFGNRALLRRL